MCVHNLNNKNAKTSFKDKAKSDEIFQNSDILEDFDDDSTSFKNDIVSEKPLTFY